MKVQLLAGSLLLVVSSPAFAISAGEFLNRAEPMMKKSKASLIFSREARFLLKELGGSAQRTRARLEADRSAGRPTSACIPPKGQAKIEAGQLLAYIRALPPAQKAQSLDQAFAGHMAQKYPCRS